MFQIQQLAYEILAKITAAAGDKYEGFKPRAEEIADDTKNRLIDMAKKALNGDIAPADLPGYAENELSILKTELLETAIVTASAAQDIINSTIASVVAVVNSLTGK